MDKEPLLIYRVSIRVLKFKSNSNLNRQTLGRLPKLMTYRIILAAMAVLLSANGQTPATETFTLRQRAVTHAEPVSFSIDYPKEWTSMFLARGKSGSSAILNSPGEWRVERGPQSAEAPRINTLIGTLEGEILVAQTGLRRVRSTPEPPGAFVFQNNPTRLEAVATGIDIPCIRLIPCFHRPHSPGRVRCSGTDGIRDLEDAGVAVEE